MPSQKPDCLDGRVAVITGSTRGIGRVIAELFGRAGARVVVSSSRPGAAEATAADLCAQGLQCAGFGCDVSDQQQVQRLFEQTLATWGDVDIWVNNAGISGPFGYTLDVPTATWERVIRTNLLGCYYGCTVVLPHFLKRRYGKMINVSGGGAHRAQPCLSAYSSSKAAVVRFSDALAREYRNYRCISINVLEPGLVATDMITQAESIGPAQSRLQALPRVIRLFGTTAEEAAHLALHMASSKTDGVSGKLFTVMPRHRAIWRLLQTAVHLR